jgi:2-keto-4-pentenoate hydratase/2-oxohepta-3-ene-1,7-dioic acid hydratase in catechol pathway
MRVTGRLNGEEVQCDSTGNMIFSVPQLIAYLSTFTELLPGDVIATGTPAGVGMSRKPPRYLREGDVFEVDISGVGRLRNPVHNDF